MLLQNNSICLRSTINAVFQLVGRAVCGINPAIAYRCLWENFAHIQKYDNDESLYGCRCQFCVLQIAISTRFGAANNNISFQHKSIDIESVGWWLASYLAASMIWLTSSVWAPEQLLHTIYGAFDGSVI